MKNLRVSFYDRFINKLHISVVCFTSLFSTYRVLAKKKEVFKIKTEQDFTFSTPTLLCFVCRFYFHGNGWNQLV